jgi:pimeloyl-ACP methyl ester carboxylesterase
MSFSSRQILIAGHPLHYREAGSGPLLLFLHGSGGADSALPFLLGLSDRYRVVVPDHPGFGRSADPPWLQRIDDVAFAYLEFLEALDLADVHLVGASLGGWIALQIALRDARRLRRLTLVAAAGIEAPGVPVGDLFGWSPEERMYRLVASRAFAEKLLALRPTPEQAQLAQRNDATAARLSQGTRFADPLLQRWLHRIRTPTHVVWGAADGLFPPAYGQHLASLIPGARFSVIDDCGHLPAIESPERLAELVTAGD